MFITRLVQVRKETTQAVTLQTGMWEVLVSNLAQDTNYPNRFFVGFITALWKMTRGQKSGHGILLRSFHSLPPDSLTGLLRLKREERRSGYQLQDLV